MNFAGNTLSAKTACLIAAIIDYAPRIIIFHLEQLPAVI